MAAAALSRSRGAAGGLFILFTLLCLVCLASSRIDDEQKRLKEDVQKIEQVLNNLKARRAFLSEFTRESFSSQEALIARLEDILEESPDDFPPLKRQLEISKGMLEKFKRYINEQNEFIDATVADIELNLGKSNQIKLLRAIEERHAEL